VWEALTKDPGLTSEDLAGRLGTDPFYTDVLCRTAFLFGLLERQGPGWHMAAHFDQILGDPESSFYLAYAPGPPVSGSTSSPTRSSWPGG
jgi:hypothetical protein